MINNSNQPKSESSSNQSSPGKFLKKSREERGLSIDAIHEGTKIPLDVLRAIEEGYTVRTLSPFYLKGFYKIYATYLGVEITNVIQDYKPEKLPKHVKIEPKDPSFSIVFEKIFTRQFRKYLGIGLVLVIGMFFAFKVFGFISQKIASRPKVTKKVSVTNPAVKKELIKKTATPPAVKVQPIKEAPVRVASVPIKEPAVPAAASSQEIDSQLQKKGVTLTVRAKKDCWLRVKVDQDVVFQSTLHTGAVETWLADERIEISGKNLNVLDFDLNGKLIGTLCREDRKATLLEVTRSGLKVLK